MTDKYSYPDFIEYCTKNNNSFRSENEIFWSNRIPVPSILVKRVFFSSDTYLKEYVHHLLAGTILALNDLSHSEEKVFQSLPDPEVTHIKNDFLKEIWNDAQGIDKFKEFERVVSSMCGLGAFELNVDDYLGCLSHKGKKYDRLYYPEVVKQLIEEAFPKVFNLLKRSNGDMFGNVVVERLNIYRSGFSDAFTAIFNRFLDFKFELFPNVNPLVVNQGQTEIVTVRNIGFIEPVEYAGGNWWNPVMQQGGAIGVEIDLNHPINTLPPEEQLHLLLLALAKEEMFIFNDEQKMAVENYRFRVSQELRITCKNFKH